MALSYAIGDGTTTVNLNTSGNYTLAYVPRQATAGQATVEENFDLLLTGASASVVRATAWSIQNLLAQAGSGVGATVYLQAQLDGDTVVWQSEVLGGRLLPGDLEGWGQGKQRFGLVVERRNYWEGAQVGLGLKRTGVTKTTSGVTIYNHHDSTTHENFVDIEGADIAGAIPTPLVVFLETAAVVGTRRFYLSANTFHTPASFTAIYEGEASTAGGGALESVQATANSSGGNFMRVTWTGSIAHTRNAYVWSVASAQLGYAAGAWFRVLARLENTPPANCYAQLKVKFDGTTPITTLWEGPEILLDSSRKLQDLGSVQLPPGYISGVPTALALVLSLRHTGTSQLDLDFVQLSGPDGVHRFDQQGYQLEIGDSVVDDGIAGGVYVLTAGALMQHIYSDFPPPLFVWPGRDVRLRMLFDEGSGMVISRTMKIYAQYRPRRLTV